MSPFQGSLLLPKLELSSPDQHASLRALSNVTASETPVPTVLSKVTLHQLCPLTQIFLYLHLIMLFTRLTYLLICLWGFCFVLFLVYFPL